MSVNLKKHPVAPGVDSGAFNCSFQEVADELVGATDKHAPMNSLHEAYAVILEEVDELWEQVRLKQSARSRKAISEELTQIAAMAIRAKHDLGFYGAYLPT
jgi:hypothetical protein